MSTFGTQPTFNGAEFFGISTTPYQIGELVASWPGGTITQINVYAGGWQAACTMKLCIWNSSGTLLFATSNINVPQASGTGANQQDWVSSNVTVNIAPDSGGLIIGLWRDPAARFVYSRDGSSTYKKGTNTTAGNLTGTTNSTGTLGAYVIYTPPPAITNLSPSSGIMGTSVTITGTNFGASQGAGDVKFDSFTASITSWSDTSIVCTVPTGFTTTTTASVTVTTNAGYTSAGSNFSVIVGGIKYVSSTGPVVIAKYKVKYCTSVSPVTFQWVPVKTCSSLSPTTFIRRA